MPSILIIEDEPSQVETFIDYLEAVGWNVGHARTGSDGIDRMSEKRWDIILLDIRMVRGKKIPVGQRLTTGVYLLDQIRRGNLAPLTPKDTFVIVRTAVGDEDVIAQVEELEPDALLLKGTDLAVIMQEIDRGRSLLIPCHS
ncbi:MAG TPA: response regulator [Armatimonadota bacterium]|nr:response regulator [Armatimonadota bacterium]